MRELKRHCDMWWEPAFEGARKRRTSPRCIVLHTTGGEGDAAQVYETLRERGLSIHYVGQSDGSVYEMACPETTVTYHAEYANGFSVGIEIANYLHRRGKHPDTDREKYHGVIHGRRLRLARSYPQQLTSTVALVDSLCQRFGIPRHLPRGSDGELYTDVMPRAAVRRFRGVLGHFHVTTAKIDPGLDVFDALDACGYR